MNNQASNPYMNAGMVPLDSSVPGMRPGEAIVLERVGNGWLARPFNLGNRAASGLGVFHVFNDLGVAATIEGKESLCTFVEQHFRPHVQGEQE